jgi:prepilin-type N-terminal cleavage/methylation domain-containing protein
MSSKNRASDKGFTLIEVMVAGLILTVGLLALAYAYGQAVEFAMASQQIATAQQKAQEAMENVMAASNSGTLPWAQFSNTGNGGVFLAGCYPLTTPGGDGIIDTADDGPVETITLPGPDGKIADGTVVPLSGFLRQIQITDVNSTLKQVQITVYYATPMGGSFNYAQPNCPPLTSPHYQVTSDVYENVY